MKVLVRQFFGSWITWLAIGGCVISVAALLTLGLYLQRMDYERRLDASELRSVEAIGKRLDFRQVEMMRAIADLKAKDQQSEVERERIKQTVAPLRGLSKALEGIKEAVKPEGKP